MAAVEIPPGHLGNLNAQQTECLEQFRSRLPANAPPNVDDYTCLRFLRARKFDVNRALELYSKQLSIREAYKLDTLLEQAPQSLLKMYGMLAPHSFHNFDKLGRPCYIQKLGAIQLELLASSVTVEQVLIAHAYDMEFNMQRAREQTERLGRRIETVVNILDCEGLSMKHRDFLKYLKAISKFDEDAYPETLGRTYIINTPWIFPALWKIIKAFLDPVVAAKVVVLRDDYKETLLQNFDADCLPAEYGGACRCRGGCVALYDDATIRRCFAEYEASLGMVEANIGAGRKHQVEFKTDPSFAKGTKFSWYFRSKDYDVGFSAHWLAENKEDVLVPVFAYQKCDSHVTPQSGSYIARTPGKLVFIWDNSYSRFRSKTFSYSVQLSEAHSDVVHHVDMSLDEELKQAEE
eukprot:TRINITY_DN3703_c0_g1_i1.p1 TRINITY_DN3703_c0_g1~~TRINITY_DN3703_c0_g1_i1.p1  ORF type:complete len:406 (-),score=61.79 TRINITY_DN3703_c0_g1_i1:143-1360(-)